MSLTIHLIWYQTKDKYETGLDGHQTFYFYTCMTNTCFIWQQVAHITGLLVLSSWQEPYKKRKKKKGQCFGNTVRRLSKTEDEKGETTDSTQPTIRSDLFRTTLADRGAWEMKVSQHCNTISKNIVKIAIKHNYKFWMIQQLLLERVNMHAPTQKKKKKCAHCHLFW